MFNKEEIKLKMSREIIWLDDQDKVIQNLN